MGIYKPMVLIVAMAFSSFSSAAVKGGPKDSLKEIPLSRDLQTTQMALNLPAAQRAEALRARGEKSFEGLVALAKSDNVPLSVRWKAVTNLGRVFPMHSKIVLREFTYSKEWYLRNASLVALKIAYEPMALQAAIRLLDDKALVVRTAAVQMIEELGSRDDARKLWAALNHPRNFRNNKSLWIRPHIMRTLAKFSQPGDELKFASFINDRDPKVQLWTLYALEKVTGDQAKNKDLSFRQRKKKWTSWARKRKATAQL
jgi:hypothetical protein